MASHPFLFHFISVHCIPLHFASAGSIPSRLILLHPFRFISFNSVVTSHLADVLLPCYPFSSGGLQVVPRL
eukprot:scaffold207273_cov14-Prasinocladus_malaysianus.AAC.1